MWYDVCMSDTTTPTSALTEDQVRLALRRVRDPELNLNIVDIGLVYAIRVDGAKAAADLAKAAIELGRSEELAKLTDASAAVRELAKSSEALARLTDAGMHMDAAAKFVDMARMVETGKLTTENH